MNMMRKDSAYEPDEGTVPLLRSLLQGVIELKFGLEVFTSLSLFLAQLNILSKL